MRRQPKSKRKSPYGSPVKPQADGIPFPDLPIPDRLKKFLIDGEAPPVSVSVKPEPVVQSILTAEKAEEIEIPEEPVEELAEEKPKDIEVIEPTSIVKSKRKVTTLQRKGRVGANDHMGRLDFVHTPEPVQKPEPEPVVKKVEPKPEPEPPKIDKKKAKYTHGSGIELPQMIVGGELEPEPPTRYETDRIIVEEADYDDYED